MRNYKDITIWKNVTETMWNDWHWQLKNRITNVEDLEKVIHLTEDEKMGIKDCLKNLRMSITPYYAMLMDIEKSNCPIRSQAVPRELELRRHQDDLDDPTFEDVDSPAPHLTHRYPDRALFLLSDQCAMYCRHCTRRRLVGSTDAAFSMTQFEEAFKYIESTPVIRDVILSGGDPLSMSDEKLEKIIARLRNIPHVEIIRIGSRTPVVMPQRITDKLCEMLKKYHPIYLNTQFNHASEITDASKTACEKLVNSGILVGNQSVLLKGINDCPHVMKKLLHGLMKIRVRPYYLYQCDRSVGIEHFVTSVGKGIEIMESLRGHTSGLAIPWFILEAQNGGGKCPILPHYLISRSDRKVIMRNFEGVVSVYTEPDDNQSHCECEDCTNEKKQAIGLRKLYEGETIALEPVNLERAKRRKNQA
ncbi:MAG TPA: lysine 2,3-aminomutase [Clostridiales bacterium]|jgi:lysine 2,3-aminomutase|nr:lysine 2,3-aminomutase [Clostridiales bacterium]